MGVGTSILGERPLELLLVRVAEELPKARAQPHLHLSFVEIDSLPARGAVWPRAR
jgi:hypothetical protein